MRIRFHKYQGTGNDFVILDNRQNEYDGLTMEEIRFVCHRRFGVGADGLMLLNTKDNYDFEMKYYNADGNESSMCGNGGRCLVQFAHSLGMVKTDYHFSAVDGDHEAKISLDGIVSLKMKDVEDVEDIKGDYVLDTGSPHYIKIVHDAKNIDVFRRGADIRNSPPFDKDGINVNFVQHNEDDSIFVRTYERGVEDETMSCGTGVTASALMCYHNARGYNDVLVYTKGGKLNVEYDRIDEAHYKNVWLSGPAVKVYEGEIETNHTEPS